MKKLVTVATVFSVSFSANAHDAWQYNEDIFEISAAIFVVVMLMWFIINVMKRILEYRLKNKIVDKGISESIAQSILETRAAEDSRNSNIKWFSILAGVGLGLTFVNVTKPFGFHSLAIMAFSISLSFLGYYFFTKNAGK